MPSDSHALWLHLKGISFAVVTIRQMSFQHVVLVSERVSCIALNCGKVVGGVGLGIASRMSGWC